MFSMEKDPGKESTNLVKNSIVQQTVESSESSGKAGNPSKSSGKDKKIS